MARSAAPALALLLLLAAAAPSPARAEERLAAERYELANGLRVILHEDHTLPVVATNIWYHVGAREEPPGRSGFAHLFEHLMFMGTERVPNGAFDQIMESGGSSNNASTDFDRTNYFAWGPADQLPVLLWLEADRMEGLARAMTQEKLDLQRDVVRNERREGYDDAPYGEADLLVWEAMFPHDHPYHHHIIGSHEDLQRASVDDVVWFFETFYVPNNATLVVAGDFEPAVVKPLIQRTFGSIPRGAEPPRRDIPPVGLEGTRRIVLHDDVQRPRITLVWHSPPFFAPGDAEMDLVAGVLAQGESSRLRRRLLHDEALAVEVHAWQSSLRHGSLFSVEAVAAPGVDVGRLEAAIEGELARLREEGPTPEELDRVRAGIRHGTVARLESLGARADRLNLYDAYLGHPDGLAEDLGRYAAATPEGVREIAREVLGASRLEMVVLPPGEAAPPGDPLAERPAPLQAEAWTPPAPETFALPGGLELWHLHRPGLPLVTARLLLPTGSTADPAGKEGLADLVAALLLEGAGDLDALAFAAALESRGIELDASAGRDTIAVELSCLVDELAPALDLFAAVLEHPRFDEAALARVRTLRLARLDRLVEDPASLGTQVAMQAFFGSGSPYAAPVAGWPRTVGTITREDVEGFAAHALRPRGATLLVASPLEGTRLRDAVAEALGGWLRAERPPGPGVEGDGPAAGGPLRVLLVPKEGSTQTVVRLALPGHRYAAEGRVARAVLDTLFGGSFTSRLNANLREEHGYTYGAWSHQASYAAEGAFLLGAGVQAETTGAAVGEMLHELGRLRAGDVTEEEAAKARATARGDLVQAWTTQGGALGRLAGPARHGLGPEQVARDLEALERVDAARLNALAREAGRLEGGVLVLVGDEATIRPQLEALDLPAPILVPLEAAAAGRLP